MLTSPETTNISNAIIAAAAEIKTVQKNKKAYGYKYASLDAVLETLRPPLTKHGLWFVQSPSKDGEVCTLTTRIIHTSGEWIQVVTQMTDTELQGKANDTQRLGASITYYRRYVLSSIFGIATDEDVDGNLDARRPDQNTPRQNVTPAQNTQSTQPAANQKRDPLEYIASNFSERATKGEGEQEILKDYADILKCDVVNYNDLTQDEQRYLARELFKRALHTA